jgi:predicted PurR-regulated permease PerM
LAEGIIRITRSALAALAGIALIIVVSIYWTGDRVRFERLWLSFLQPQRRLLGRTVWRNVEDRVGDYLRGQSVQGTMVAGLLTIGYLAFGMSYPTLLATLGAFASLIPIVGVLFAVLPFAVAALGGNIPLAILSSTYTVAVFAGLKHYLLPRIFGRQRTNSGLLAVLFMVPLFEAYGLIGLAVAPPLAMAIETITVNIIGQFRPKDESVAEQGISDLRSQLDSLQSRCETSGEELPMETANIFRRLSDLLAQAEQQLSHEISIEGD